MNAYDKNWKRPQTEDQTWRTRIPDEEVALLKSRSVKKILDLGCGDGTTLAHLSSLGFDLTGIDYSKVGIDKAKEKVGGNARLIISDIYQALPFHDEEFDAVISYQVINHNTIEKIRGLLEEIQRILKPTGVFSVKVADSSTYAFIYHDGLYYDEYGSVFKQISDRTFLPLAGHEKGVIHYEFNEEILVEELQREGFTLINKRHIGSHLMSNWEKRFKASNGASSEGRVSRP